MTPNTKTFTALIGSVGRQAPLQQALDLVGELLATDSPHGKLPTYTALMAACEKGGLWELALALFQRLTDEVSLGGCIPPAAFGLVIAVGLQASSSNASTRLSVPRSPNIWVSLHALPVDACKRGGLGSWRWRYFDA